MSHDETASAPRAILEGLTSAIYESNERAIEANLKRRDAELARIAEYKELIALIERVQGEMHTLQAWQSNTAVLVGELKSGLDIVERYVRVESSRTKQEMKEQEGRWLKLTVELGQQVAILDKSNQAAAESNRLLVDQLQLMFGERRGEELVIEPH